jgi:hypothetical protein
VCSKKRGLACVLLETISSSVAARAIAVCARS